MASLSCELDGTENHPGANPPGPLPAVGRPSQPTGCDQDSCKGGSIRTGLYFSLLPDLMLLPHLPCPAVMGSPIKL